MAKGKVAYLPEYTFSLLFLLTFRLSSSTPANYPHCFSKVYAFGDSYTDTGNTHSGTGPNSFQYVSSPPYGHTFFHHPTNRYSDGRLVVDFLADSLSLPFLPPYLNRDADTSNGVNFAVAGSTALDHDVFVNHNITLDITPQSLQTQLGWFDSELEKKGCSQGSECGDAMDGALFWVGEIGANDYAYILGSLVSIDTVRELAVANVGNFLQVLIDKGAKYLAVQGLPLLGCLPLAMTFAAPQDRDDVGCSAALNQVPSVHNSRLRAKIQELRQRNPNVVILYADFYGAHLAILKNAAQFGFVEPFRTCCGAGGGQYNFDLFATCGSNRASLVTMQQPSSCADPTKYVNWDGVHMTDAMYGKVADLLLHQGFCEPAFDVMLALRKCAS